MLRPVYCGFLFRGLGLQPTHEVCDLNRDCRHVLQRRARSAQVLRIFLMLSGTRQSPNLFLFFRCRAAVRRSKLTGGSALRRSHFTAVRRAAALILGVAVKFTQLPSLSCALNYKISSSSSGAFSGVILCVSLMPCFRAPFRMARRIPGGSCSGANTPSHSRGKNLMN